MLKFLGFESQYVDEFRPELVFVRNDGKVDCKLCGATLSKMKVAKLHVKMKHKPPEYFKCSICEATIKHRQCFSSHINKTHHINGSSDNVKLYGQMV